MTKTQKQTLAPLPKPTDIAQEKPDLTEYVCARCFRKPDECACGNSLPEELVVIDEGIQEHVRILNEKGYTTSYCCESHSPHGNLYIQFQSARGLEALPPLPSGFRSKYRGTIVEHVYGKDSRTRKKMTTEAFEQEKAESLTSLLEWCESLPALASSYAHHEPSLRCAAQRGSTPEEAFANYACPYCDKSVTECASDHVKATSAHLRDRGIRRHLDLLDEKGYSAESGCAGHGPGSSVFVKIWPSVVQNRLTPTPEGFEMRKDLEEVGVAHFIPEGMDGDAAEADRLAALDALFAWCESLPECDCPY